MAERFKPDFVFACSWWHNILNSDTVEELKLVPDCKCLVAGILPATKYLLSLDYGLN
jgi:hypothetical protein